MISPPVSPRVRRAAYRTSAPGAGPGGRLTPIAGLGASGHAKCTIEAIRSIFRFRVVALLDADSGRVGSTVLECPVIGGDGIAALRAQGVEYAFVGLGGVGDPQPRRTAAALLRDGGFALPVIVHRTASVAVSAESEEGAQVMAGAIVGPSAVLARDVLVNAGAIVGHDVWVGECAHVASGARLAGGVRIGAGAHVGTGAVVLQGRFVGDGAVIGAGAVVIDDVPPGGRVGGIPARPLPPPRSRR